jgi:cell division protein FtsI/penicillin-binding protein 2/predicted lipoprotein with Yx(FWY)xxD motif
MRTGRVAAWLVAGCLALAGCAEAQAEEEEKLPSAEAAAEAFVAALATGDFTGVPLAGFTAEQVAADRAELLAEAKGLTLSTHLDGVTTAATTSASGHNTATAAYTITWRLDGSEATAQSHATSQLRLTRPDSTHERAEWQAVWDVAALDPSLEPGEHIEVTATAPERGRILGLFGAELVSNQEVYRVGIDKMNLGGKSATGLARQLAKVLDIDADAFAARVAAAGPRAFVIGLTVRADDLERYRLGERDFGAGVLAQRAVVPLAPTADFAKALLGTSGEATAEAIEESDGLLQVGDYVGLSGLQKLYDTVLRGSRGLRVTAVGTEGAAGTVIAQSDPGEGHDVVTTLDVEAQMAAEAVLEDVEGPSALVAIKASTGEIVAAASGPGSEGYSTATLGQYAPGSTFKVITALALLRAGYTPNSPVECPRRATVDGRVFTNFSSYPASSEGQVTLAEAFAQSCNTAFVKLASEVSQQDLADAAQALGVNLEFSVGPEVFGGSVPAEAGATEHAASMIGQGQVLMAPLDMAIVAASVAASERVVPHLVTQPEPEAAATETAVPGLTEAEAEQLQYLMQGVVTRGSGSVLASVADGIGAKTGTAEYGSDIPPQTHAWMIAYMGDLAVAGFVETGDSGSGTVGPLLKDFLTKMKAVDLG